MNFHLRMHYSCPRGVNSTKNIPFLHRLPLTHVESVESVTGSSAPGGNKNDPGGWKAGVQGFPTVCSNFLTTWGRNLWRHETDKTTSGWEFTPLDSCLTLFNNLETGLMRTERFNEVDFQMAVFTPKLCCWALGIGGM